MPITAVLSGTGLSTPPYAISNEELVASFNAWVDRQNDANAEAIARGEAEPLQKSSEAFIEKASGIKNRYLYDRESVLDVEQMRPRFRRRSEDEMSMQVEISLPAAKEALSRARVRPEEIDAVIVSCANLQRPYPAVAIELQSALGCGGYAFDMNVACSSATFAIKTAVDAIRAGSARRVLLVNPEITSAHANFRDRDSHFIFGDVCTASVIEAADTCRSPSPFEIIDITLFTQFSNNIRNDFGFLNRCEEGPFDPAIHLFRQQGRRVFKDVVPAVVRLVRGQLDRLGISPQELRRVWLHQANLNMNNLVFEKLFETEPSSDRAPTVLDEYANTASAGALISFHKNHEDVALGELGLLASFGAGYSIGSAVVRRVEPGAATVPSPG